MMQQSIVLINGQEMKAKNKVKTLRYQLKELNHKNMILQSKIKDLGSVSVQNQKSPISQLQENLHLDRRFLIEQFKPLIDQEGKFIRNERIKTENDARRQKVETIQQKKLRVKQIEQYDADVIKKKALYNKQKIEKIRRQCLKEMEINQMEAQKKLEIINDLEHQQSKLFTDLEQATQKGLQLFQRYARPFSKQEEEIVLPSLSKQPILRRSITFCKHGLSPSSSNQLKEIHFYQERSQNPLINQNSMNYQIKVEKNSQQQLMLFQLRKTPETQKFYINQLLSGFD